MFFKMAPCSCSICEFCGIADYASLPKMFEGLLFAYSSSDVSWRYRYVMFSDVVRAPREGYAGRNWVGALRDFLVDNKLIEVVYDSGIETNPNTGNEVRTIMGRIKDTQTFWKDFRNASKEIRGN